MTKFGPWKIWNGGENPCPGGKVQWHSMCGTRVEAQGSTPIATEMLDWSRNGFCSDVIVYREVIEPVRETVRLHAGGYEEGFTVWTKVDGLRDTHRITFDLIDGEPDCASILMERMK